MWKMLIRRILILIPQLFFITIFVFILATAMPGDALSGLVDPTLSPETIAQQRVVLGLDDPLPVRYINWISGIILEGDFGRSFTHRRSVNDLIAERVVNTFWLSLVILILQYLIAIPLGILAGRFRGKPLDKGIMFYVFLAMSMPTLILGILMIFFFAFRLGWFPSAGSVNAIVVAGGNTLEIFINRLHHMVLPAATGALLGTSGIILRLRANIIDRTHSDYVIMARSKGVPTGVIFRRHILRNSLVPIAATIGFAVTALFTGILFIEMIFRYPGMGMLFFDSINVRDFAVVNALVLIFSVLTAIGMLISDIALMIVDPRIRIE
jgi:peptide/nickel transport system permease protein